LDHFSALEDPRQSAKVLYPLAEILLIVLCATMAGADDFVEMERWAKKKLDFLRRLLPFKDGVASHDTLNDVINALPAAAFPACFTAWVKGLRKQDRDIVAIDGKTSRCAHDRGRGKLPLHMVSAWARRQRLVLGQQACAEKSNEITAIPELLGRLELTGALVTIDAPRGFAAPSFRSGAQGAPGGIRPESPTPSAPGAQTICSPTRTTGPR
jgi:hypothetical protein